MSYTTDCGSIFTGGPDEISTELIGKEVEFIDQDTSLKIPVVINFLEEVKPDRWLILGRVGKTGTFMGKFNFLGKVGNYKIS